MPTTYSPVRVNVDVDIPYNWRMISGYWLIINFPWLVSLEIVMLCEWLSTSQRDMSANLAMWPAEVQTMLLVLSTLGWLVIFPVPTNRTKNTSLVWDCLLIITWILTGIGLVGLQLVLDPRTLHGQYSYVFFVDALIFFSLRSFADGIVVEFILLVYAALVMILWGPTGVITENWPEYSAAAIIFLCWFWDVGLVAQRVAKYVYYGL